ncbi:MAG: hypothetical protein CMJ64_12815 [Planctomycetaceae bacterium]|nr:hypothetical protein [Planctomycetaceae bacterium]
MYKGKVLEQSLTPPTRSLVAMLRRFAKQGYRRMLAAEYSVLSTEYTVGHALWQRVQPPAASLLLAIVLFFAIMVPRATADTKDDEQIEQFLNRLGLVDLQTLHLEQVLDRQTEPLPRQKLAERLADIYASQLLTHSADKPKYDAVVGKIDALMTSVPTAKTPSLEVMLLQADYNRTEGLIGQWMANRSDNASLNEAASILIRIAPELDRLQTALNELANKLVEAFEFMKEGPEREAKEKELARLQPVVGRASYFAAWSNYYLGLTKNSSSAYEQARKVFRQFLALGDEYSEEDVEYLGLELIWRARALIGLALTEAALDAGGNSERCFEWLGHASVPPEIRQQTAYWRLQAFLNTKQYARARSLAESHVNSFDDRVTQGRVSFCVSLVQAAYGGGTVEQSLGTIGLGGLIKIGQRQTAKRLMEKYDVEVDADAGFYLQWLRAQQLFEQAERTKEKSDYAAAKAAFAVAVGKSASVNNLSAIGQSHNQFGWCYFRLGEHAKAADRFKFAAERLTLAKDRRASDSTWMAFVAFQAAAKKDPTYTQRAIDALNTIKRDSPDSEYAKKADYYIGKLRQNSSPEETMRSLEWVKPGTPDYASARYEIAILRYQKWIKASKEDKAAVGKQVSADIDTFLKTASDETDAGKRAKVCLIGADVGLQSGELSTAASYVEQARSSIATLARSNSIVIEYHYRTLQIAQKQADEVQQRVHADWIVKNASGSRYELPAVIVMARIIDQRSSGANASNEQLQQGYKLYSRLVELLGDSAEAIRSNKNAQVANSKLAHYAAELGHNKEAAERMDKLLDAATGSKNKSYLRRAGLAHYHAGSYETAIGSWRTLLRGVTKGSDDWFEAKYYQLACLFKIDSAKAKPVFEQFKLLYPKLGGDKWRDKFSSLGN